MPADRPFRTWSGWVAANAAGEFLGLGIVFACGFLLFSTKGEPRSAAALILYAAIVVVLGAIEGAIVGWAQWLVLRRVLPGLPARSWVAATVAGAVLAWVLGMIPSTLASLQAPSASPSQEPPQSVILLFAAALGAVAGLILSFAQWTVLRRLTRDATWWLPANAAAWALGMPWIFQVVSATVAEEQNAAAAALLALGLGGAGAMVGAVHGLVVVRFAPGSVSERRRREGRAQAGLPGST